MKRNLCAGAYNQAVILIKPGDDDMRFQGCLLDLLCVINTLDNQIRFRKILLQISILRINHEGFIMGCVRNAIGIGLIMNNRSAILHGIFHVKDCRKNFPIYFNQTDRFQTKINTFSRNGCHTIADKTHFIV